MSRPIADGLTKNSSALFPMQLQLPVTGFVTAPYTIRIEAAVLLSAILSVIS
jgi:hypothetical protein